MASNREKGILSVVSLPLPSINAFLLSNLIFSCKKYQFSPIKCLILALIQLFSRVLLELRPIRNRDRSRTPQEFDLVDIPNRDDYGNL